MYHPPAAHPPCVKWAFHLFGWATISLHFLYLPKKVHAREPFIRYSNTDQPLPTAFAKPEGVRVQ